MNNLIIKLRCKLVIYILVSFLFSSSVTIDSYINNSKLLWLQVITTGITLFVLGLETTDLVLELREYRKAAKASETEEKET